MGVVAEGRGGEKSGPKKAAKAADKVGPRFFAKEVSPLPSRRPGCQKGNLGWGREEEMRLRVRGGAGLGGRRLISVPSCSPLFGFHPA